MINSYRIVQHIKNFNLNQTKNILSHIKYSPISFPPPSLSPSLPLIPPGVVTP